MTIVILPGSHGVNGSNTVGLSFGRHRAARSERVVLPLFDRFGAGSFELLGAWRQVADLVRVPGRWIPDLAYAAERMTAPDRFFAMTSDSLTFSLEWQRRFFPRAKVVAIVCHPNQFEQGGYTELHRRRFRRIFERLPDENVMFMDRTIRDSHARMYGRSFAGSALVAVPVEAPDVDVRARTFEAYSVVSVGRLVDFKYHHPHVIRALATLRERGVPATYTIYGTGQLEERLRLDIQALGAGAWAHTAGHLPYERLGRTLSRAWAFVGMGTALVDAAMRGVPSLVTAMGLTREPTTNGWYHELDGSNFFQVDPRIRMVPVLESLERLVAMPGEEYLDACEASRAKATANFGVETVMKQYDDVLERASPYSYEGPDLVERVLLPASIAERVVRRVVRDPLKNHT